MPLHLDRELMRNKNARYLPGVGYVRAAAASDAAFLAAVDDARTAGYALEMAGRRWAAVAARAAARARAEAAVTGSTPSAAATNFNEAEARAEAVRTRWRTIRDHLESAFPKIVIKYGDAPKLEFDPFVLTVIRLPTCPGAYNTRKKRKEGKTKKEYSGKSDKCVCYVAHKQRVELRHHLKANLAEVIKSIGTKKRKRPAATASATSKKDPIPFELVVVRRAKRRRVRTECEVEARWVDGLAQAEVAASARRKQAEAAERKRALARLREKVKLKPEDIDFASVDVPTQQGQKVSQPEDIDFASVDVPPQQGQKVSQPAASEVKVERPKVKKAARKKAKKEEKEE